MTVETMTHLKTHDFHCDNTFLSKCNLNNKGHNIDIVKVNIDPITADKIAIFDTNNHEIDTIIKKQITWNILWIRECLICNNDCGNSKATKIPIGVWEYALNINNTISIIVNIRFAPEAIIAWVNIKVVSLPNVKYPEIPVNTWMKNIIIQLILIAESNSSGLAICE